MTVTVTEILPISGIWLLLILSLVLSWSPLSVENKVNFSETM